MNTEVIKTILREGNITYEQENELKKLLEGVSDGNIVEFGYNFGDIIRYGSFAGEIIGLTKIRVGQLILHIRIKEANGEAIEDGEVVPIYDRKLYKAGKKTNQNGKEIDVYKVVD